jgi:hypothetical protein
MSFSHVMASLVPAISIRRALRLAHRDHRHKAGDDVTGNSRQTLRMRLKGEHRLWPDFWRRYFWREMPKTAANQNVYTFDIAAPAWCHSRVRKRMSDA